MLVIEFCIDNNACTTKPVAWSVPVSTGLAFAENTLGDPKFVDTTAVVITGPPIDEVEMVMAAFGGTCIDTFDTPVDAAPDGAFGCADPMVDAGWFNAELPVC